MYRIMSLDLIAKKIFYLVVTLSWAAGMFLLVHRHYGHQLPSEAGSAGPVTRPEFIEEQWFGIYLRGEKIGYSSRKLTPANGGYTLHEQLGMKLTVMDTEKTVEAIVDAELGEDLTLLSFRSVLKADIDMDISGRVEDKMLLLSIHTGGTKLSRTVRLKKVTSLYAAVAPGLMKGMGGREKKISMSVFDPATMSIEDVDVEVAGEESIMSMGKMEDAYTLKGNIKGAAFTMWVTGKGEVLREESAMGFTLIKEKKEDALRYEKPSLDFVAQMSVPFNLTMRSPVRYLKIRVSGVALEGLELDGGRQHLNGDILEIRREDLESTPAAGKGVRVSEKYFEETFFIRTKDPEIITLAEKIIGDEKNPRIKARLLNDWLYTNIKKVPVISIPVATEVLGTRAGDCNEHTILYTALARSAGLPARVAVGLVYQSGAFYYHAWPEVYLGEWVAVDPTLGQFPADAAHIRLLTGDIDKQTRLLGIIGNIRFEGLAYL